LEPPPQGISYQGIEREGKRGEEREIERERERERE
jgi:hypothetical protein